MYKFKDNSLKTFSFSDFLVYHVTKKVANLDYGENIKIIITAFISTKQTFQNLIMFLWGNVLKDTWIQKMHGIWFYIGNTTLLPVWHAIFSNKWNVFFIFFLLQRGAE